MIDILFEHPWFLVINKPFGLLTQAVPGIDSVQVLLAKQMQLRNPDGPVPFLGIPHRLDRVTTGVMVIARNQRALRRLCDQFAVRKVDKTYCALVPKLSSPAEKWVDTMRKVPDHPKAEIVLPNSENAKEAILHYRVVGSAIVECNEVKVSVSHVEITLETGRMHQIRLQFAHRGHPILGDHLYGSPFDWHCNKSVNDALPDREPPIALHARRIAFHHPQSAELLTFEAPLPIGWPSVT